MRDKSTVIAELKALVKQLSDMADAMPDCGGLQGAAVLHAHPELKQRLIELGKEAEAMGVKPEEVTKT